MVGRKENGQFDKGNRLARNGGRKPRAQEEQVKAALRKAITEQEVLDVLAAAIKRREGWAIQLYLAYMWGKPIERVAQTDSEGNDVIIREAVIYPPEGAADGGK